MTMFEAGAPLSRRRALKMGAVLAGGLAATGSLAKETFAQTAESTSLDTAPSWEEQQQIQDILQAQGSLSNGVFMVEVDRNDIKGETLHGIPVLPSFQINGAFFFQSIGNGQVMMNGDMALKQNEVVPFLSQLIMHDIVLQAEHQHFYDLMPLVWFEHFRAVGTAATVASGLKAALYQTSTPFPQMKPSNPTTPLPAEEIGSILGASPQIGADGVVTYFIPRAETITLGGKVINPYLNVATNVVFEPYGGGWNAAVAPDYAMIASEINNVIGYTQKAGWDIGCLYNQETAEEPQLYFSHNFKYGLAIPLAKQVRMALNMTNSKFM